ncbi:unnamed protein product [Trypanosoma congolense IL3000]|uniref:WGS project CAEQ00000000 data, annotated contig 1727 n=1 Tax=Trypanosoma congolense (strain IL3000) TaxID=1068625 RepID=F9W8C1_TRYCI|nr:unnamed protein product [Trypanosoma congolense IL3000]
MEKIGRGRGTGKLRAILKPKEQLFGGKYGSGGPVRGMGTEEKSVGAVKDFANKGSHQGITSADHALEGSTTSLQPRSKVSPESRRKRSILNPLRKKQLDHTAAEENEAPRPLRSKYLTQSKELSGARLATSDVSPAGDQGQQPAAFTTPMVHGPMQTLKGGGGKLSPTNSLIRKKLTQKRRKGSLPLTSVPDGSKVDFSSKGKERKTKKLPSECSSLNSSITCTANTVDCVAISGDDARQDDNGSQDDGRDPSLNESRDGQLTPYDEEDEEEAVHRYMENNKASLL